jgi:hypothetical protein
MVDQVLTDAFSPVVDAVKNGTPSVGFGAGWIIGIALFIGIAIFCIVGAFVYYHFWAKKQWKIKVRVHYENPTIDGVSMGSEVLAKRIRFKDGRVVYMYKSPIQGYTISPELLTWTRPLEHDVIVTQDKKLFSLVGINSIDVQRKKLNVDVSYPDIEMDRQDLQQHIDSKKFDDPNERFKIMAKVALWIFVIVGVIVVTVLGGKTYIDSKSIDAERDKVNLQVSANQAKVMEGVNTFLLILSKTMPDSFKKVDGQDLLLNVTGVNG